MFKYRNIFDTLSLWIDVIQTDIWAGTVFWTTAWSSADFVAELLAQGCHDKKKQERV